WKAPGVRGTSSAPSQPDVVVRADRVRLERGHVGFERTGRIVLGELSRLVRAVVALADPILQVLVAIQVGAFDAAQRPVAPVRPGVTSPENARYQRLPLGGDIPGAGHEVDVGVQRR